MTCLVALIYIYIVRVPKGVKRERNKRNIWRNNGQCFVQFVENYKATNLRSSMNPKQ